MGMCKITFFPQVKENYCNMEPHHFCYTVPVSLQQAYVKGIIDGKVLLVEL